ncbi:MAG: transposase [Cyanobacteria bacterium P01_G01_bin.54]
MSQSTVVIGLDVCRSSVVCCQLFAKPDEPREFYDDFAEFTTCYADASGVSRLLDLAKGYDRAIAVLEPTGVNYSQLWGTHLARNGVEVWLVGHTQLASYRESLDIEDKTDELDAFALACYWFDYNHNPRRFVQVRKGEIVRIRQIVLRLAHLNRVQNPIINRLRQDLQWQFPEVANVRSLSYNGKDPLLWGWIAGKRTAKKYDALYEETVGTGLRPGAIFHANRLCELSQEEWHLEQELRQLASRPEFAVYQRVFAQFQFGQRVAALLLSQIYPIENYLDEQGKPIVLLRKGKRSGKPTKRHKSRRRFEKALGCAPREHSSGATKRAAVVGGSDLCRVGLWQWFFTKVEVRRNRKTPIAKELGRIYDEQKNGGTPIALVRSRCQARTARKLFYALLSEMQKAC